MNIAFLPRSPRHVTAFFFGAVAMTVFASCGDDDAPSERLEIANMKQQEPTANNASRRHDATADSTVWHDDMEVNPSAHLYSLNNAELGNSCSTDIDCSSGFCVDGVCCDSACTNTCVACNVPDRVGTCTNIGSGLSDPNGIPACNDICNGDGKCVKDTGGWCDSGIQCLSHICNDHVCESSKPSSGPLEWLTVVKYPLFYPHFWPSELTKLEQIEAMNGDGVAVDGWTGYYESVVLMGGFDTNGYPNLGEWNGSWETYHDFWRYIGRGGVEVTSERTGHFSHIVCFPNRCGSSASVHHLIGMNDAGQRGAIVSPVCDLFSTCNGINFGDGVYEQTTVLVRYSGSGALELKIPPPVGIVGSVVLGPTGEFYSGSATSLAKHDVNGLPQWTKLALVSGSITNSGWDVDAFGNILIGLAFSGTVDYGGGPMTALGPRDLGLIKLDPAGNFVWQKQFGGNTFTMGTFKLSRTGSEDVSILGRYSGSGDLGLGALHGDWFVAKFDSFGTPTWHVDIAHGDAMFMSADPAGAVYVGSTSPNADFGWGTPLATIYGIAMAKYQTTVAITNTSKHLP